MNKTQLIDAVAAQAGLTKVAAKAAVDATLGTIAANVAEGVQLLGFGNFSVSERAARTGRNPHTGETIQIPASKVVRFKASKTILG